MLGDAGDGVKVTGVLVEGVCFFFSALVLTLEAGGGSMSDLGGWSSKLVFLGFSSLTYLLLLRVNFLLPSTLIISGL